MTHLVGSALSPPLLLPFPERNPAPEDALPCPLVLREQILGWKPQGTLSRAELWGRGWDPSPGEN